MTKAGRIVAPPDQSGRNEDYASSSTALTAEHQSGSGNRTLRTLAADERGQVVPLALVVIIALLATGMLVLWLSLSTSIATNAQTAADAAALGAEQSVDTQWNQLVNINGVLEPQDSYDPAIVKAAADRWAGSPNQGKVVSVEYCSQGSATCSPQPIYTSEPDVMVTVQSTQSLPSGSISPGSVATAQARASTDPYDQASPAVPSLQTSATCDSSGESPPITFRPHGGQFGFFAASGTNFDPGCEQRLAAHLDVLGKRLKLHLVGIWGAGATDPAPHATVDVSAGSAGAAAAGTEADLSAAHGCGAAVEVQGLPGSVTAVQLAQWGLTRFTNKPDEIEFISPAAHCTSITTIPPQSTNNLTTSVGNGKVHLVSLTGGPQGTGLLGIGAIPGVGPWPAISSYMPIYEAVAKQYGWDQAQLQDWLGVEKLEDPQGILNTVQDGAFGLAQFRSMNFCHFGPGSCPQDNPSAAQEIESMAEYIKSRYGDPAAALAWEQSHHWY